MTYEQKIALIVNTAVRSGGMRRFVPSARGEIIDALQPRQPERIAHALLVADNAPEWTALRPELAVPLRKTVRKARAEFERHRPAPKPAR
jgi:hypothetical protein